MSTAELFITKLNDIRTRMNAIKAQDDNLFVHKVLQEMPMFMSMVKTHFQLKLNNGETIIYGKLTDSVIASYHDLLNDKQVKRERRSNENNQTNQQVFFTQPKRYISKVHMSITIGFNSRIPIEPEIPSNAVL